MVNELHNNSLEITNDKFSYLCNQCYNCMLNHQCPKFKHIYDGVVNDVETYKDQKTHEINNAPQLNEVDKYAKLETLNNETKKLISAKLKDINKTCVYEDIIVSNTIKQIDNKYDIINSQQVISIIEQVIKLKLYDFRLMLGHKKYGMFQETAKGIKTVAGLHYSMEIADKVATLLEKLDKIVEGDKVSVNINVDIANRLQDIWKKRREKVIDMPNLKENN